MPLAPGCDRPPSWTEAHYVHHWARDGDEYWLVQRPRPMPSSSAVMRELALD